MSDALLDLASSILDGTPIDWEEVERSTPVEQRELLRGLKLLSTISELHRPDAQVDAGDAQPTRWGTFEIRERIGGGSHGDVHLAWDTRLHREVALKLLQRPSEGHATTADGLQERWLTEARRLAAVRHPNVVSVYTAQEEDGVAGIAMELVRGRNLEERLRDHGTLGANELAALGIDLCRALAAIHHAGLLHHDIKASNVMREEGGRVVLMDLGVGGATPVYMAPELLRGEPASTKTDLYALGVLLHHLASGGYPVRGATVEELRAAHDTGARASLRDARPDLPAPLVRAIERAHAADPSARFESAGQLEAALLECVGDTARAPVPAVTESVPPAVMPASVRSGLSTRMRWVVAAVGALLLVLLLAPPIRRVLFGGESRRPERNVALGLANAGPFSIRASFYRGNAREPLHADDRLALGDSLALEIEASETIFVYVVDEDAEGRSYLLFPLRGFTPDNPLPPNDAHQLPGARGGRRFYWQVTTSGGRERLVILASRARLVGFEAEALALDRAREGREVSYPRIEDRSWESLHGLGGLVPEGSSKGGSPRWSGLDQLPALADGWQDADGVFARQIELENPAPR